MSGRWYWATLAFCAMGAASAQSLQGAGLAAALRGGGYVIVMRHASSPHVPPAATEANPDNLAHERQLDATGRDAARNFGDAVRRLPLPLGSVLSSPTYRARETLRLAQIEHAVLTAELGDGGQSMLPEASGRRGAWLRAQVAQVPTVGTDTLFVTHYPNISEAFAQAADGLADGEALIFHPDGQGGATVVARMSMETWQSLATTP